MLLSSFFTRSMVFAHIPRAQLLFALLSETFLTIRQNSLNVTVCMIARSSCRGYFIHSLSTLYYYNAPSLTTRLTGDYRDRTYTGKCSPALLDTRKKRRAFWYLFLSKRPSFNQKLYKKVHAIFYVNSDTPVSLPSRSAPSQSCRCLMWSRNWSDFSSHHLHNICNIHTCIYLFFWSVLLPVSVLHSAFCRFCPHRHDGELQCKRWSHYWNF